VELAYPNLKNQHPNTVITTCESSIFKVALAGHWSAMRATSAAWRFRRMKADATIMSSTFWLMPKPGHAKRLELEIQECVGLTTDMTPPWGKNWDQIFHSNLIQHKNRFTPEKVQLQNSVPSETKNWKRYYVYGAWWKSPEEVQFYLEGTAQK